jgi:hypothetical protein
MVIDHCLRGAAFDTPDHVLQRSANHISRYAAIVYTFCVMFSSPPKTISMEVKHEQ